MSEGAPIELRFRTREALRRVFLDDMGVGGLLWEGAVDPPVGALRSFVLRVGGNRVFEVLGRVVWRKARPPGRPDLAEGAGVEFDEDDTERLDVLVKYLTDSAGVEPDLSREERQFPRLPVDMPAEFLVDGKLVAGRVVNLSEEGVRLRGPDLPDEGERLFFFLYYDDERAPLVMEGTVVWLREAGGVPEAGIDLQFDTQRHRARLRRLVERLAGETAPRGITPTSRIGELTGSDPG